MFQAILGVISRHGGNALGTFLTTQGLATGSETEAAVGALIVVVSFVWSVFQKHQSKNKPVGEI